MYNGSETRLGNTIHKILSVSSILESLNTSEAFLVTLILFMLLCAEGEVVNRNEVARGHGDGEKYVHFLSRASKILVIVR